MIIDEMQYPGPPLDDDDTWYPFEWRQDSPRITPSGMQLTGRGQQYLYYRGTLHELNACGFEISKDWSGQFTVFQNHKLVGKVLFVQEDDSPTLTGSRLSKITIRMEPV